MRDITGHYNGEMYTAPSSYRASTVSRRVGYTEITPQVRLECAFHGFSSYANTYYLLFFSKQL